MKISITESKAIADWDKGAYRQVRENWEYAIHRAGDNDLSGRWRGAFTI